MEKKIMKILHLVPDMKMDSGLSAAVFNAVMAMRDKGHASFVVAANIDDKYRQRLREEGILHDVLPISQFKKSLSGVCKGIAGISKIIKRDRMDLVHSHHRWHCLIGTLCARLCGIASVTSDHNILFGMKRFSFWADGIITDSEANKRHLTDYFHCPAEKITIVPPLMDRGRYDRLLADHEGQPAGSNPFLSFKEAGDIVAGVTGRFVAAKGHAFLIDVVGRIVRHDKRIKVLLLGRGPLEEELMRRVEEKGLGGHIKFLGVHDNLVDFLAVLDMMVFPSQHEGFCLAATEAVLYGLPVVAARVGGLPEQVIDRETGYVLEPGDKEAFTEKIRYLMDHPQERRRMGKKGREYLREKYCYAEISDQLEAAYGKIVTKSQ